MDDFKDILKMVIATMIAETIKKVADILSRDD